MQDVSFRPVQPEDLPQLAVFCSQFPGDGRSVEFWTRRFQHWWQDNPAMTDDWLRGYQLFVDGVLQGVGLAIPLRVVVKGSPHLASLGSTWRVMPKHRAWSMAVAHEVNSRQQELLCFNGTPTERVLKIIKNSYRQVRGNIASSLIPLDPRSLMLKCFKRNFRAEKLPTIISNSSNTNTLAAEVNALWSETSQTTGPVRDWKYWQWFAHQKSSIASSIAVLPGLDSNPPVCGLLVEFDDGKLQLNDIWPASASKDRVKNFLKMIIQQARKKGYHTFLIPHFTPALAAACNSMIRLKNSEIKADIWTNPFQLPQEDNENFWPLYTGDALL